jgi:hypothetical protein
MSMSSYSVGEKKGVRCWCHDGMEQERLKQDRGGPHWRRLSWDVR